MEGGGGVPNHEVDRDEEAAEDDTKGPGDDGQEDKDEEGPFVIPSRRRPSVQGVNKTGGKARSVCDVLGSVS